MNFGHWLGGRTSTATPPNSNPSSVAHASPITGSDSGFEEYSDEEEEDENEAALELATKRITDLEAENRRLRAENDELSKVSPWYIQRESRAAQQAAGRVERMAITALRELCIQQERLLDRRSSELRGVNPFLLRPDQCSMSDLCDLLSALNREISRSGADLTELYESANFPLAYEMPDEGYLLDWRDSVRQVVGSSLFNAFEQVGITAPQPPVRPKDTLPVEVALQAYITHWCIRVFNRFEGTGVNGEPDLVKELYHGVRVTEEPFVCAGWRVLACNVVKNRPCNFADKLAEGLRAIMYIAGLFCAIHQDDITKKTTKCAQRIEGLVLKFRAKVRLDILSSDMEMYGLENGLPYDVSLGRQSGSHKDHLVPQPSDRVLCTVGPGLQRVVTSEGKKDNKVLTEVVATPIVQLKRSVNGVR